MLASASPRRRELLAALGSPFDVVPSVLNETLVGGRTTAETVERLARAKALAVAGHSASSYVLGADTLVEIDGEPLGKPENAAEARAMLARLRGRDHEVLTGVCLVRDRQPATGTAVSYLKMRAYSDDEIEASIARGTPFDKAGGYAIQDLELAPVAQLNGCYCNVVGLPLWTVWKLLNAAGFSAALRPPDATCSCCRLCPYRPHEELTG